MDARDFLDAIQGYVNTGAGDRTDNLKLATIPAAYTTGAPNVIFDGETLPTAKAYPCLSSYTPYPLDRVVMLKVGASYVVLGAISTAYVHDTGWVNIATVAPHQWQGTGVPQVRRIGKVVHMKWGWNNTGMATNATYTVGQLPRSEFYPPTTHYVNVEGNHADRKGRGIVWQDTGAVQISTGSLLSSYYLFQTSWVIN